MERQEFGQREELAQFRETPLAQPLEVHFALREEDIIEGSRAMLRVQRGMASVGLLMVFLGTLMVLLGNVFFGLFMVAFMLVFPRSLAQASRKKFRQEPVLQEPMTWIFSEQQVTVDHPRSSAQHDWSVYKKVVETPHLFMLFPQDNLYQPIPKRAFADAAEMERFREMIRERGIELRVVGKARQS